MRLGITSRTVFYYGKKKQKTLLLIVKSCLKTAVTEVKFVSNRV
jgi:hypothetical protein